MRFHLSLGGNLGDRAAFLGRARTRLREAGLTLVKASSVYETEPVGLRLQPWFFNQVLIVETELSPWHLLNVAQSVESVLGRRRKPRNGPRTIDIDLLLAEDSVLLTPALVIPHPRMAERRFVLVPLVEIDPRVRHPLLRVTARELLRRCPDRSAVIRQ